MAEVKVSHITCPGCGRTISNAFVESAASGEGNSTDVFVCECGGRITFWQAVEQLRDQKKPGARIGHWFRSLSKGKD